jgi:hypothetical protein
MELNVIPFVAVCQEYVRKLVKFLISKSEAWLPVNKKWKMRLSGLFAAKPTLTTKKLKQLIYLTAV